MHELINNLPPENKWINMAHGQDVQQKKKRVDHFNFTDHSPFLTIYKPVKCNLHTTSKWMHSVRMYRKWKREQTNLISQIIPLCWNAITMHEPVKSNLRPENKWMHMVRMYRKWKKKTDQFNFTDYSPFRMLTMHEPWKVAYRLRINECTWPWSGNTASGIESRPF